MHCEFMISEKVLTLEAQTKAAVYQHYFDACRQGRSSQRKELLAG